MKRVILIGLFLALFTFLTAVVLTVSRLSAHGALDRERANAFRTIQKLEAVVSRVMDAENAWDNFGRTKDPRYLDTYKTATQETIKTRDELRKIFSGPHTNRRFEDLSVLINSRLAVLRELLNAENKGASPEVQVEILRREELIHNALLQAAGDLERNENAEISVLNVEMSTLSKKSISCLMAAALLCVITFAGLFHTLYRELLERKRLEQAVRRQAHSDSLTGLPNRLSFGERLDYEIRQAHRSRAGFSILYLDVDHFKDINDSLGHEAGDQLLKEVGNRLRASVRESDSVARIGGDEFNILLTNLSDAGSVSRIAEKVIGSFHQPFMLSGHVVSTGCSIGIGIYPEDGEYSVDLLRNADLAMYHAKQEGRNRFKFYNSSLNTLTLQRVQMEEALRHSLEKNEMVLHYQPQIDIKKKRIVCVEAMVRWRHPEQGLLKPLHFIPLAEGIGFIEPLDEWVLRTACAQIRAWQARNQVKTCMSVNLSPRELKRPDLIPVVSRILDETGFDPRSLVIELSEEAAIEDIENTAMKLQGLRKLGVGFTIDHFGGGYSSLNNLKLLSLHKIKMDKSFIREIESSRYDQAIIRAIIVMAHAIDIRVVAQGVENQEQMRFLEEAGCDEAQGDHVCSPVPAEELSRFTDSYDARAA